MFKKVPLLLGSLTATISVYAILVGFIEFNFLMIFQILIILISSYSLFSFPDIPFSLFKIYHTFNLFFFGIAPAIQYQKQIEFLNEPMLKYEDRLLSSFLILISTVLYSFFYLYYFRRPLGSRVRFFINNSFYAPNSRSFPRFLLIFISICCFVLIFYYNNFNIFSLLIRGGEYADRIEIDKMSSLIMNKFLRPIPLIIFLSSLMFNPKLKLYNFVLFIVLLFTAFPLGMPRNDVAGFYIPVLLIAVPFFSKRHIFVSFLIVGLLVIFPFLNNFRRFGDHSNISIGLDFDMFTALHFDAYASLTRIVANNMVTYGNQLLGVFLFFIPRSIWDAKPDGSGIYQADELRLSFSNISCPFIAEGYINFGFFGVFVFTVFLAFFSAKMDRAYWEYCNVASFLKIPYLLILGMFLFVLRGDLMNGFSYTIGFILASYFVYKLIRFFSFRVLN